MLPSRRLAQSEAEETAADLLKKGGVIAFPTDTLYGIGCAFDRPRAVERVLALRNIDCKRRPLTFLLPDLGELARYAQVTEEGRRILTRILPGPYCVELLATPAVPEGFVVGHRRTIGVRVPDHPFCEKLLWSMGIPLVTATAKGRDGRTLTTARAIAEEFGDGLDLVVDGGELDEQPSTVVSLVDDWVTLLRRGRGNPDGIL